MFWFLPMKHGQHTCREGNQPQVSSIGCGRHTHGQLWKESKYTHFWTLLKCLYSQAPEISTKIKNPALERGCRESPAHTDDPGQGQGKSLGHVLPDRQVQPKPVMGVKLLSEDRQGRQKPTAQGHLHCSLRSKAQVLKEPRPERFPGHLLPLGASWGDQPP